MMKVTRNYGNGIVAEVDGKNMKELLVNLAQADEIFYDIRAFRMDPTNPQKVVVSDKVKFGHRKVGDDQYFEQICTEGQLKFYKRHIGEFKGRDGEMYVHRGPPKKPENLEFGLAGWNKYIGKDVGGEYHSDNAVSTQPQYTPQPQPQYAPQPQTAPPQQQYNAHAQPPQQQRPQQPQYQAAAVNMDDIPF